MLKIDVVLSQMYDEAAAKFVDETFELKFEHSLVSLSKWEEKYEKPFLDSKNEKTYEETLDYVRFMILNEDYPKDILNKLTKKDFSAIHEYLERKMTATWFNDKAKPSREIITAEIIYYWMISYSVPFEAQYWHLNKLFTLIKVCNAKNDTTQAKVPHSENMAQRRALNAARRKQLNSKG